VTNSGAIIVGGGISGLATAYYLGKQGIHSTLLERSERLGGLIRTDLIDGCQLEAGPDSYIAAKPAVSELAAELPGLKNEIIGSNDAVRRIFIVRDSELTPFPPGMVMMVPGELCPALRSPLFSAETKLRFLRESSFEPKQRGEDVSIADFVSDHFGRESLEYVTEPLLSGVYGGDSASLSAKSVLPRFLDYEEKYGSLIRGVQQERKVQSTGSLFLSFHNGMQSLVDALSAAVTETTTVVHGEAIGLERIGESWRVSLKNEQYKSEQVVLACPAHAAAALLKPFAQPLSSELEAIPFSSSVLVNLLFKKSEIRQALAGFGFLVPRPERRTIAAVTWINNKFPSRVADEFVALRAFLVDPESTNLLTAPEALIGDLVFADLDRFMGLKATPVFSQVTKWPRSMPQYLVGHESRCNRIRQLLEVYRGLQLVTNALEGVGIPDCVRLAKKVALQMAKG